MRMTVDCQTERLAALRLARTERIGAKTYLALVNRFGSPSAALDALPGLSRRGGRTSPPKIPSEQEAEAEFEKVVRLGARMIALDEAHYPEPLSHIDDPPPVLTVLGNADLLKKPTVGIVGARNASLNGRKFAERLARDLGEAGFVVASGFAKGIDTAAHKGSLPTGTIAAMAGGIDVIYPLENTALYDELVGNGAAISEQRLGTETRAQLFPRRNRLISGLSRAVIVVEAAGRSGSLLTARIAAEQGREVMAVPGSPLDPRSAGTNKLLKEGAVLVRDADDVLNELQAQTSVQAKGPMHPLDGKAPSPADSAEPASDAAHRAIRERLTVTPTAVDELLRDCQLPAPDVLMALLELEIAGQVTRHPGNRISLS